MRNEKNCSLCGAPLTNENPDILNVGSYGYPRFLCEECSARLNTALAAMEPEVIRTAMEKLNEDLMRVGREDVVVTSTMMQLFDEAKERLQKIEDGTYDDATEEDTGDDWEDVPEELRETEEDRALDEADEEKEQRADRISNYVAIATAVICAAILAWFLLR